MANLHIYKASAGSGKTHLLTQKWLLLAFENTDNYNKILAVTFTNKAADEMKSRILEEINNIIEKGSQSIHYQTIKSELNLTDSFMQERAKQLRDNILHNYSLFSVNTIDSFVQRIIRAFSFELDVNSNYEIELDQNKVLDDLTELLYRQISERKDLQKHLIKFAKFKINEGKSWDFKTDIGKLAKQIFTERFQSLEKENFKDDNSKFLEFTEAVFTVKTEFENKITNFVNIISKSLSDKGIEPSDLGSKFKTIANYFLQKIARKKEYEPLVSVRKAAESDLSAWHKKNESADIIAQIEELYPLWSDILEQTVELFDKEYPRYISAKIVTENIHAFGILKDISALLPDYRNDNNILLISDTTLLLKEIIGNNDAPFIYEKTGSRFKHILIDEFQDTSGFQWANFRPLIENALSEGRFNLIVGDIKQSIYRWRGGDWKLLLQEVKNDIGAQNITDASLDTNWRSKKNIVDFNNAVFANAPKILQDKYNIDLNSAGSPEIIEALKKDGFNRILTDAYRKNYQLLPDINGKKGGRTRIEFIPAPAKFDEEMPDKLASQIENLLSQKNYEPGDITILVRTNNQAKQIMQILMTYQSEFMSPEYHYPVISADSLYINNSQAVRILSSAVKYLINPKDSINAALLIHEYTLFHEIETYREDEIFHIAKHPDIHDTILPEDFIEQQINLKRLSLYELTEHLISVFKLNTKKSEFPYLQAYQDAVSDYTRRENNSLPAFIEWWDEKGSQLSIQLSDNQNAVKILTIHKSKGLAFKICIIPFANWAIEPSALIAPLLWASGDEAPYNSYDYLPVKYKKDLGKSVFRRDYFDEKLYMHMDALNMLYVAFTRPKEELIIYAPVSKKPENISHIGDLLYQTVKNGVSKIDAEGNPIVPLKLFMSDTGGLFEMADNYKKTDDDKFIRNRTAEIHTLNNYPNYIDNERISINFSSEDFFIESIESVAEKVNFGTLMHKIFAEIKTAKDAPQAIQNLAYNGYIDSNEIPLLTEKVNTVLNNPEIKYWFDGSMQVITEKAITTDMGEIRIPDRVLFNNEKAVVIDFKFGEERPEHMSQISEYKHLIENLYNIPTDAFLYYAKKNLIKKYQ